jgi:hypothetical protein
MKTECRLFLIYFYHWNEILLYKGEYKHVCVFSDKNPHLSWENSKHTQLPQLVFKTILRNVFFIYINGCLSLEFEVYKASFGI